MREYDWEVHFHESEFNQTLYEYMDIVTTATARAWVGAIARATQTATSTGTLARAKVGAATAQGGPHVVVRG